MCVCVGWIDRLHEGRIPSTPRHLMLSTSTLPPPQHEPIRTITAPDTILFLGSKRYDAFAHLFVACRCSPRTMLAVVFVSARSDAPFCPSRTPFHDAAILGRVRAMNTMLIVSEAGAAVVDGKGQTPLHNAAYYNRVDAARVLLMRRPDAGRDDKDQLRRTPLHYAAVFGYIELVSALLKSCPAALSELDVRGYSPLHIAVRAGHVEVVRLMCQLKPLDLLALRVDGATPIELARENTMNDLLAVLCETVLPSTPDTAL